MLLRCLTNCTTALPSLEEKLKFNQITLFVQRRRRRVNNTEMSRMKMFSLKATAEPSTLSQLWRHCCRLYDVSDDSREDFFSFSSLSSSKTFSSFSRYFLWTSLLTFSFHSQLMAVSCRQLNSTDSNTQSSGKTLLNLYKKNSLESPQQRKFHIVTRRVSKCNWELRGKAYFSLSVVAFFPASTEHAQFEVSKCHRWETTWKGGMLSVTLGDEIVWITQ